VQRTSAIPTLAQSFIETIECSDRALVVPELAALLRISPGTVYRLARKHAIPSFRIGGSIRFDPLVLSRWMRGLNLSAGDVAGPSRRSPGKAVAQ
jgi:excisionase family DNA binding protein